MTESNNLSSTLKGQSKKTGGGAAFGGGANFQASLTAIVGAHILRGTPLGWLDGVCDDRPVAVWAESEGPGDDLRIELADDTAIEVQAKKGLSRSDNLWTPLLALAKAIHTKQIAYGILAVASDASTTIREDLADDIERLGQGRIDQLSDIAQEFARRLKAAGVPPESGCHSLRIRVIDTLIAKNGDINAAKSVLRDVCVYEADASAAWDTLCHSALRLIENRGRWALRDLVRLLRSRAIKLRDDSIPAGLLDRFSQWVCDTHNDFAITGVVQRIPIDHLLPMQLEHRPFQQVEAVDLPSALERYQRIPYRHSITKVFDSVWTARFKTRAVVIAGPGLGKSTMLRELAHQYALDGFMVLTAQLSWIAAGIRRGQTFPSLLMENSFSESNVSLEDVKNIRQFDCVVLLDALDECGQAHEEVADHIRRFAHGHPKFRIIVTTRPIGYTTNQLEDWVHYTLLPPTIAEGDENLEKLLRAIAIAEDSPPGYPDIRAGFKHAYSPSEAFAISPQLLGMSAALIHRKRALPRTRVKLYTELINLFEKESEKRMSEQFDVNRAVLEIISWILLDDPLIIFNDLLKKVAKELSRLMEGSVLSLMSDVRTAVKHWTDIGLIERVCHGDTEILVFIHKTFCEFMASRYLLDQPEESLERAMDEKRMHEAVEFGVGMGLADSLISLHLKRHVKGITQQLQTALGLLAKPEIKVSASKVLELVQRSFKAVDDGENDKFIIGLALCNVGPEASLHVSNEARYRLESQDPAIRLVAWAAYAQDGTRGLDVAAALRDLEPTVPPTDLRNFFVDKQDRSDLDLLRRLALGALKAQPNHCARDFAENEIQGKFYSNASLLISANANLRSRELEPLQVSWDSPVPAPSGVSFRPIGPTHDEANLIAAYTIAKVFAAEVRSDISPRKEKAFPQFSAFLNGSGYMRTPASDVFSWIKEADGFGIEYALKHVASYLPLDLDELAQESSELLALFAAGNKSIFHILPNVDISPLDWEQNISAQFHQDEIKQAIFHPSDWVAQLAACICCKFPIAHEELESLMTQASGRSLWFLIELVRHHHPELLVNMAWRRFVRDATGDVSSILELFSSLEVSPVPQLMEMAFECLCSMNEKTANSAVELLNQWLDQGVQLDKARVERAVEHWGGREDHQTILSFQTPLNTMIGLADRIADL